MTTVLDAKNDAETTQQPVGSDRIAAIIRVSNDEPGASTISPVSCPDSIAFQFPSKTRFPTCPKTTHAELARGPPVGGLADLHSP